MSTLALASLCLLLGGGLLVSVIVAEAKARGRLVARRLAALEGDAGERAVVRPVLRFDRTPARDPIKQVLSFGMKQTWGVRRSGRALLAVVVGVALAVLALAMTMNLQAWMAAPAALALGAGAARLLVKFEQGRAEASFVEEFPGTLDSIIRVLRAGMPVTAAIRAVAEDGHKTVAQVFAGMADQIDIGVPMNDALAQAAAQVRLPDFRFFTVSVALQHGTGGNLTLTLETLSDIIRRRRTVRKKVKALTSEVRMSSYILGAVPIVVLGILTLIAPSYLSPLLHDPRGKFLLGGAFFNLAAGFLSMQLMMRRAAAE